MTLAVSSPSSRKSSRQIRRWNRASSALLAAVLLGAPVSVRADAVSDWSAVTQSVRESVRLGTDPAVEQVTPLVALAMYDAVIAIDGGARPYLGPLPVEPGALSEAAAHAAARRILVKAFPADRARFDSQYEAAVAAIPDEVARSRGIAVGEAAAARLLAHRAGPTPEAVTVYRPLTEPGVFVPPQLPAVEWMGRFRPFVLRDLDSFRTPPPPPLASAAYARDYEEVRSLGERNSGVRTGAQTSAAKFWSSTSLAQLLPQVFKRPGRTLAANARLYAAYAAAEFDMSIMLASEKYRHNFWRPVTAIRNGDRDGNPVTERDAAWEPLLATPAHPDHPCGHCLMGALTATLLTGEVGDTPDGGFNITAGGAAGGTRRFASLAAMAAEVTDSRIWGGVHFRTGAVEGELLGRRIAARVNTAFAAEGAGGSAAG